ncbi:small RNA-binding protein 11, chloroplastic [Ricinus communis]|uniref:RNA binding protein, putative n=1 Tax=Ricinus communis TaxID=3988 RepID=B9SX10_RICCO|nr:small RNA-binding protein 11, chloroplastic [Ricinus communis]EEF31861.1 RNA binding protein, putative [Ricinus communis]|eukprot:XP_002530529.1 small RNA-binding protein 11, chloroplastic [Ricinus communis]
MMTAMRRIAGKSAATISTSPSLFVSYRGIATKLFVGGLSFYTTDKGLTEAFSQYGQVVEATIVSDRVLDRSKGFGFVTFASEDEAHNALSEMNGKTLNGRVIYVDYAKPRTDSRNEVPIARGPPEPS